MEGGENDIVNATNYYDGLEFDISTDADRKRHSQVCTMVDQDMHQFAD